MKYGGHGIAEAAVARRLLPGSLCLDCSDVYRTGLNSEVTQTHTHTPTRSSDVLLFLGATLRECVCVCVSTAPGVSVCVCVCVCPLLQV